MPNTYEPITNEEQLAKAIILLWNNGKYQPWYDSFKSLKVIREKHITNKIGQPYDAENQEHTWLTCLGSNLVTDAMDLHPQNTYDWEDTPQVEVLNAIDEYVHKS